MRIDIERTSHQQSCIDDQRMLSAYAEQGHQQSGEQPRRGRESLQTRLGNRFPTKGTEAFLKCFTPGKHVRILDVGGHPWQWENTDCTSEITILNAHPLERLNDYRDKYQIVVGDVTDLRFNDDEFDLVFSNSVIEHLGTFARQQAFANEVRRVGRRLWIQTPARSSIIEPHLVSPVIHWLPRRLQKRLIRYGTVWGLLTKSIAQEIEDFLNEIRFLSFNEMKKLFPDCYIHRETFIGFTRSFIGIRN